MAPAGDCLKSSEVAQDAAAYPLTTAARPAEFFRRLTAVCGTGAEKIHQPVILADPM